MAGVSEEERLKQGEFGGIDWGEEEVPDELFDPPAKAPDKPKPRTPTSIR